MTHLIIIQNGLNGFSFMMNALKSHLQTRLGHEYSVVISDVNDFYKTYDGIVLGAYRLYQFIIDLCEKREFTTISFIGHSLGGLYIRYCIGLLEQAKFFTKVQPMLFSTIATPHLGIRQCSSFVTSVAHWLIGQTGTDLLIEDHERLLLKMSDPESCYIRGLTQFQTHLIYGNLKGDRQVPFETACIVPSIKSEFKYDPEKLYVITPTTDCKSFDDKISLQIYQNLSVVNLQRKAIDLSTYHFVHNAIANKGLTTQTMVLDDIIDTFHSMGNNASRGQKVSQKLDLNFTH